MRDIDNNSANHTRERELDASAPALSRQEETSYADTGRSESDDSGGSFLNDLTALLDDGRTYAQAEVAFQKSRAGFAANRAKYALVYGAAAFGALHLALIAVAVGLVIALVPLVGPWIATAIVGAVLVVIGLLFLRALKGKVDDIRAAFAKGDE